MKLNKIILVVVASITLLFGAADEETVNVNFRNLDIKDFVEMISKISQKNILVNGALKGKIQMESVISGYTGPADRPGRGTSPVRPRNLR